MIAGRRILLGVSGSIAAFKAVALASELVKGGATVDVLMTPAATRFVSPLSFQALTHRPVVTDLFDPQNDLAIEHVGLARAADLMVIAPATANLLARLSLGLADDPVTATALALTAPLVVAPAMETHMYEHPATQEHLARLRARGVHIVEPAEGRLASGQVGRGRMAEPAEIMAVVQRLLSQRQDLAGRHLVVTAGGTREPIDPVRFIGNWSSGKMGYAIAEAARDRGARVTLISGPTALTPPAGVTVIRVTTAQEMLAAVQQAIQTADALIMAAAVADYRPAEPAGQKIKKSAGELVLRLVPTPDILASLRDWPGVKVGFAAETGDLLANAEQKLRAKNLDLIVANDVTAPGSGFGSDTNQVVFLQPGRPPEPLPLLPKRAVADRLLDKVVEILARRWYNAGEGTGDQAAPSAGDRRPDPD